MELRELRKRGRLTVPARLTEEAIQRLGRELEHARGCDLVTLEGSPGTFCEGGALPGGEAAAARIPGLFADLLSAIERAPLPVVALVDGVALGGGVGIVAAADLVLATPGSRFGLPEVLLGLIPAMVFPVLARRIGAPRARLLALGRSPLAAEEALAWGLVDEVADDLESALHRYERRFSCMGPQAVATLKALVVDHYGAPPGYAEDAASRFATLLKGTEARARIERASADEPPWPGGGGS
jgi:enoyl-CoA hydratase/carnithine racemase